MKCVPPFHEREQWMRRRMEIRMRGVIRVLVCSGLAWMIAGCVSTKIQNDSDSSPCVTRVLAQPTHKPDDRTGSAMLQITMLSKDCVRRNLKRGEFENKARDILKENGVVSMSILYCDGTQKNLTCAPKEKK
jgi:hypothetical protein